MSRLRMILSLLLLASFGIPHARAGAPPSFTHILNEPIWADVICFDVRRTKLIATNRLLSPDAAPAPATSFRLHVRELQAVEGVTADLRLRQSFISRELERQLEASCVIELDANQLASVSVYKPDPPPGRSSSLSSPDEP